MEKAGSGILTPDPAFLKLHHHGGVLLAGCQTNGYQQNTAGNSTRHRGSQPKGLSQQLPANGHCKPADHTSKDSCRCGLFPVQRRQRRQSGGGRIKRPGEHQHIISAFDVQGDDQSAQSQQRRGGAGEEKLALFCHIGIECFAQVVNHRLYRYQQIAVGSTHHHGQNT